MLADYFTKPLEGATFRKFRDAIMNCDFARSDVHPSDHRSVLEPKRANEQSHTHVPRLKQPQEQKQTESVIVKDLIQQQERTSVPEILASFNFRSGNYRFVFPLPVDSV